MPPKKSLEPPPPLEAPPQPPSLASDAVVEGLLALAKKRDLGELESQVASAVGRAEDFRTNLHGGVVVDFHVEALVFAAQHGFPPRKTVVLLQWLNELRKSVETTGGIEEAKHLFRSHILAHVERSGQPALMATLAAPLEPDGAAADASKPKPTPKGSSGQKQSKAALASPEPVDPAKEARAEAGSFLTVADVGPVADLVTSGILQHWRLYHHVATAGPVRSSAPALVRVQLQVPMAAPPLSRAIPAEQYEAQRDAALRRADEELETLRRDEAVAVEARRVERERREEQERLAEEEAKANTLYFEKKGTEAAVGVVKEEVQGTLGSKQHSITARLERLEELFRLPPMPSS